MEAALRLLTKEAMKDHNFGQTFFDQGNPSEEEVLQKADMSRANKMAFKMFTHSSEIQIRKQYKNMKAVMGRLMVSAVEEYDDIGMHLEPDLKKDPDPDKVIKGNPGFDPVFMKV